ncbi:MAG: hypothetical protein ACJAVK_002769 [Akkermansiaceae bacterium]|jgi:hypothetical protein
MKQTFPTTNLHTLLKRVDSRVGFANTVLVNHPTELRTFEALTPREVSVAAAQHNLEIVRRMGGRQLEFTRVEKPQRR